VKPVQLPLSWQKNTSPFTALRTGTTTGDTKIDALIRVAAEAATTSGNVTDVTWNAAQQGGWSDTQLAEAFAHLGLTVFTGHFLHYAQTDPDVCAQIPSDRRRCHAGCRYTPQPCDGRA
jgi:hypothetical protein